MASIQQIEYQTKQLEKELETERKKIKQAERWKREKLDQVGGAADGFGEVSQMDPSMGLEEQVREAMKGLDDDHL